MSLIQHWKLDDNAASTTVVATVGTNATLNGGDNTSVKHAAGPGGSILSSFNMNGSDDYISIAAAAISTTGAISLGIWFNANSFAATLPLFKFQANNFRGLEISSSTTILFRSSGADRTYTVPTMSTGTWYFVLACRDGSNNGRLFLNGTESSSGSQALSGTIEVDRIGNRQTVWFGGKLAWAKIFDSGEAGNVATLYAEGSGNRRRREIILSGGVA